MKSMNIFRVLAVLAMIGMMASFANAGLLYSPIVTTVGDGQTTTSSTGLATTIRLYANSVPSQASPLSSATYANDGVSPRLVNSWSATSEGSLTNNPSLADAASKGLAYAGTGYAYSSGYDAANGTASIHSSGTNAPRALGCVTVDAGSVTAPTVLQTQTQASAYGNNNIRGAGGNDTHSAIFSAGTGSPASTAGWRNFGTNTQLPSGTLTNVRTVEMLDSVKLFGSTGSGNVGIYLLDPNGVNAATPYIVTGTSSNHSPYEFALFNDPSIGSLTTEGYNVAYIADDQSAGTSGGIEKWTYDGTSWTQAYILKDTNIAGLKGYRGLAGEMDADTGLITLFATTDDGKRLQQVTDTGMGASFSTLADLTGQNYVFRGVALAPVPEPSTIVLLLLAGIGAVIGYNRRK